MTDRVRTHELVSQSGAGTGVRSLVAESGAFTIRGARLCSGSAAVLVRAPYQIDVAPAQRLHPVAGHGLGDRGDLGRVAPVVRRVAQRGVQTGLCAAAVRAPRVPT